jgi:hypothetical protein
VETKTSTYKYCAKGEPQSIGTSEVNFKPCMTVTDSYNGMSASSVSIVPPPNSRKAGGMPDIYRSLVFVTRM